MPLAGVADVRARALQLLDDATRRLQRSGVETARLDAEILLAEAARVSRDRIISGNLELDDAIVRRFHTMLAARERRTPVAYLVGRREFYSLEFRVNPSVLIPRPETECVVAAGLDFLGRHPAASVLDIGTGSGAIAVALAVHAPSVRVTAVDISADALEVARDNARAHRVAGRIDFRLCDLFDPLDSGAPLGRFDLIVSNPPYIDEATIAGLEPEIRDFEPRVALAAPGEGLSVYRRIGAGAVGHLAPGGEIIVELGAGQAAQVAQIFARAGLPPRDVINDLAGIARALRAQSQA